MDTARPVSWIKAALKDFGTFPDGARLRFEMALAIAAQGHKADIAKPLSGLDDGVFEIALKYRSDAYRVIHAVRIGSDLWVVHAFQKKSKTGIKTPAREINVVRQRLKWLKETLE